MGSRDLERKREREQFIQSLRNQENEQHYQKYVQDCRKERVEPVSLDEWIAAIPEEFRNSENPQLRAALATANSSFSRINKIAVGRLIGTELDDDELTLLGFDPADRVVVPKVELRVPAIVQAFKDFAASQPKYSFKTHYAAISAFIVRNKLEPTAPNIARTFGILDSLHLLPEPEPEQSSVPEPRVNLGIEPDPEIEKKKAWERYISQVIVIDPETGEEWTEYKLDRIADSRTYQRLMRLPRLRPESAPDAHR